LQVSDFHYDLPRELIAQEPPADRGTSRMLVVSRDKQSFHDDEFCNFSKYVRPGDCLILNNTRVFPARLRGRRNRESGAEVQVLLLHPEEEDKVWKCLAKPAKRARVGDRILFSEEFSAEVLREGDFGERSLRFLAAKPIEELLEQHGEMPLPPYIQRKASAADRERYQTVFAARTGSAAAPTAGLHFTQALLDECRAAGAQIAEITLHIGTGTFAPLRAKRLEDVRLHEETFEISEPDAEKIRGAKRRLCVGTTSVRAIETGASRGTLTAMRGDTSLFIYPGHEFRAADALLTNFHLPESSLLILVSAFAGRELVLAAYRHAVAARYRFFSYGDCMLIE
jgi:S-adenosylmethionine:tRNA ribosyltransferase-isomerase